MLKASLVSKDVARGRRFRVGADGAVVPVGHHHVEEAVVELLNQVLQKKGTGMALHGVH